MIIVIASMFVGCKQVKKVISDITPDITNLIEEDDTIAPEITAYPISIMVGEHPDYMKDVKAVKDTMTVTMEVDTSDVDIMHDGSYTITYRAKAAKGPAAEKQVTVRVTDPNKRVVYLTFDDGPSPNTHKIVEILKEHGVNATFFITGQDPACYQYIKEAYDNGNVIAAHTFSHKFEIYSSIDAYFADLEKIEQLIEKYTGHRTPIIRFPGGSSNLVFTKHNADPEFMKKLANEVQVRGYQYVDWNADSHDASMNCAPVETIINASCHAGKREICLLMHDVHAKKTTVAALPAIIQFFKDNGYEFGTIDNTAYICHHGIPSNPHQKAVKRGDKGVKHPITVKSDSTRHTKHTEEVAPTPTEQTTNTSEES